MGVMVKVGAHVVCVYIPSGVIGILASASIHTQTNRSASYLNQHTIQCTNCIFVHIDIYIYMYIYTYIYVDM